MPRGVSVSLPHPADVHLGFVPLLDAAPLILAAELGYFADEGLQVALHRQIGWGNVRDKLVYGQLHASHALVGMPPVSVLGHDRFPEPVTAVMSLGTGGNAITLGPRLTEAGVDGAAALSRWITARRRGHSAHGQDGRPVFGHVFSCSMHHYLLREWLAGAGVDPDKDVRLIVLPPPQMTRQVRGGTIDGFCVGEPWNTFTEQSGAGRIMMATADLMPGHPEKVLAANRRWLTRSPHAAVALVRAVLRACAFCHDPANAGRIAAVLSRPGYLDMPAELLLHSLTRGRANAGRISTAPNHDPAKTFPSATHAAWLLTQMLRWGHLPPEPETHVLAAARESVAGDVYRQAAGALNIACPADDFPPMALPGRAVFDPIRQRLTTPTTKTTRRPEPLAAAAAGR